MFISWEVEQRCYRCRLVRWGCTLFDNSHGHEQSQYFSGFQGECWDSTFKQTSVTPSTFLKVKQSHNTRRRCRGKRKYGSYSFTTSALDGGEWSVSRPGRVLPPGKGLPVFLGQEAGWASEPEARGKILSPLPGIEPLSPGCPVRSQTLVCPVWGIRFFFFCILSVDIVLTISETSKENEWESLTSNIILGTIWVDLSTRDVVEEQMFVYSVSKQDTGVQTHHFSIMYSRH
jgi:hypothetical protein